MIEQGQLYFSLTVHSSRRLIAITEFSYWVTTQRDKIKRIISGKNKDLYFDDEGYLIIPRISFLKQQLQKMNFK